MKEEVGRVREAQREERKGTGQEIATRDSKVVVADGTADPSVALE